MTFQLKLILFIVASAAIFWVSRTSLRNIRSHGFYRFFAWEAILALILLNFNYWFYEPFSIHQIVSWFLLTTCTFMVIHGAILLHRVGKHNSKRKDPSLMGIEKTAQLVTVGVYRYIRHPIYSSLLFLAWGVFIKYVSWETACLTAIATFFLIMTAKREEAENICYFGEAYRDYMRQTKMFIPFFF